MNVLDNVTGYIYNMIQNLKNKTIQVLQGILNEMNKSESQMDRNTFNDEN